MDSTTSKILDALAIVQALLKSGWVKGSLLDLAKKLVTGKLADILADYRSFYKLDPFEAEITPELVQHITTPRFCGRPDCERLAQAVQGPLIPSRQVRWYAKNFNLTGVNADQYLNAVDESWTRLQALCGITCANVATEAEANTIVECGPIDGSLGTLAWSELANGDASMIAHQMFDSGDSWMVQAGVLQPSQTLDLSRVLDHENMHRLGLVHDQRNLGALMDPLYSLTVDRATPYDIERLQAIYGPPKSVTKPVGGDTGAAPTIPPSRLLEIPAVLEQTDSGVILRLQGIKVTKLN